MNKALLSAVLNQHLGFWAPLVEYEGPPRSYGGRPARDAAPLDSERPPRSMRGLRAQRAPLVRKMRGLPARGAAAPLILERPPRSMRGSPAQACAENAGPPRGASAGPPRPARFGASAPLSAGLPRPAGPLVLEMRGPPAGPPNTARFGAAAPLNAGLPAQRARSCGKCGASPPRSFKMRGSPAPLVSERPPPPRSFGRLKP